MAGIFSQHVATLAAGTATDPAILDAVKKVLLAELRRRGVADFGPSLLGYDGTNWHDGEALDDLAHDAYLRAIASRLRGLRANLAQSGDIEKLVRKNLRTFVGERQARFDPVGYALFQNIKAVVVELLELGILRRLDSTTEAIAGDSEFELVEVGAGDVPNVEALKTALKNTGMFFGELEAHTRVGRVAQERITEAIRHLPQQSVARFNVGAMKQALSALIRESGIHPNPARAVSISDVQAGFLENLRTDAKPSGYEETESLEHLVAKIRRAIDALARSTKVRARLQLLLTHLAGTISRSDADRPESLDDLAAQMGVPRSTVHDDFKTLRSLAGRLMDAASRMDQ